MDLRHKPTLRGDLVTLRPVTADDARGLREIMLDPDVQRLTGSTHSSDEDGAPPLEVAERWYGSRGEHDDRIDWAILDEASGEVVGEAVVNDLDPGSLSANFRTLVGPRGRDRGLGSEAVRLVVAYVLGEAGLHRLDLEVYAFNPRARRVYEKAGFVLEGTRREALLFDGEWIDSHVMGVLARDLR